MPTLTPQQCRQLAVEAMLELGSEGDGAVSPENAELIRAWGQLARDPQRLAQLLNQAKGDKVHLSLAGMELVFAYGTLVDPAVRQTVLGRAVPALQAVLPGSCKKEGEYPTLEADEKAQVLGVCFEVTEEELAKLDAWEASYRRVPVQLEEGLAAWAYVKED